MNRSVEGVVIGFESERMKESIVKKKIILQVISKDKYPLTLTQSGNSMLTFM